MESVSLARRIPASPETIQAAMEDVEAFMTAGGFDDVSVDGNDVHIENSVGVFGIELDLEVFDADGADFAYRQTDGIFREMVTTFDLETVDGGTDVTATTDFEVAASYAGPLLDATVIKRQRKKELRKQFDYLESATGETPTKA